MITNRSIASYVVHGLIGALGVVMLAVAPITSQAQGFYVGASVGQFEDAVLDDSDTAFKVFGGIQLIKYFAVELAYADLGSVKEGGVELDQTTVALAAVGILPLSAQTAVFGKAGLNRWDADAKVCSAGTCISDGDTRTDPMYGVGFSYDFMTATSVRVEWETFEDDIGDLLSAGVSFRF